MTGSVGQVQKKWSILSEMLFIVIFIVISAFKDTQGTESSDFSLISDLFLTPRTILEISVNLKRNF